ncbi:MAG: tripartite tricarboxylate transporter substrate binding protein [Polaromonas sp.]|uniref:tripartite tricarboxylate transporter substrate binding protein n=1 Tax=Polaromonas sp. TaxID=1869339 RepID=UPI0027356A11|nr:tripartite tricarboxylate transporter substrate binding protein [Polaromonas sp.]MDP2819684.1 tripartite tricarboxylate transporter substrate binding protein [Polaromonas sp.]
MNTFFCARTVLGLAAVFSLPAVLLAQDFPSRQPVKLIVTFAPGGGTDTIARSLNTKMSEILGQTVIVENKAGAGGSIATDFVAKSAPDGYNVLFTVSSHSINQALMPKLPFDTERDLRGVTLIGALPQVIAVHPSVPANNLMEWLALGKKEPKYLNYASGGVGSPGHFAGGLLQSMSKQPMNHVPYRGAGPAIVDVMGNQVPALIGTLSGALPHIKSGKLKALAVTSKERSPLIPDVPTIAESGVPGYESDTWIGTFVPRSTPEAIVRKLHLATLAALADPVVRAKIESQAGRVSGGSPSDLDALVSKEIKQFTKVVQDQGIKPE